MGRSFSFNGGEAQIWFFLSTRPGLFVLNLLFPRSYAERDQVGENRMKERGGGGGGRRLSSSTSSSHPKLPTLLSASSQPGHTDHLSTNMSVVNNVTPLFWIPSGSLSALLWVTWHIGATTHSISIWPQNVVKLPLMIPSREKFRGIIINC